MLIRDYNFGLIGFHHEAYKPNFFFRNHHIATMYPYAFRKSILPPLRRERMITEDGDFFDVDFHDVAESEEIILLLHGLEGSAKSQYIQGMTAAMLPYNINIAAINHRSCSGEMNRTLTIYHSGFTTDLASLVQKLSKKYKSIYIAGFSMGGNMLMKYFGTHADIPSQVKCGIAFSVPCHLSSSAVMLNHIKNRPYSIQFLISLKKKIINKAAHFPDLLNANDYKKIASLKEYDDKVTAPLHGFIDAEDYYERSSARQFLGNIKIPLLLVNALDDSFLAPPCFPYEEADGHDYFHFATSRYGGHVGFGSFDPVNYWSDVLTQKWFAVNGLKTT
jgi:uncharacterized protein